MRSRSSVPSPYPPSSGGGELAGLLLLAAALAFSLIVRLGLLHFPLERDEGEYAYLGQSILQGIPPYQQAYNFKLPGTYLAYALLMSLFGQTTAGIHLGLAWVNMLTVILVFLLARDLFGPLPAGLAAACYSILSTGPSVLGTAAHANHFVALFAVAGAWALWRGLAAPRPRLLVLSGLLMGSAFLMKQQGFCFPLFGGIAVLAGLRSPSRPALRQRIISFGIFTASALAPYLACCLWLWHSGVFGRFWFWTVQYAGQYVSELSWAEGLLRFRLNLLFVIHDTWPLWLLALAGGVAWGISKGVPRGAKPFLFGFVLFSFLGLCPGLFFREQYFIGFLPAVALGAGAGGVLLCRGMTGPGGVLPRARWAGPLLWVLVAAAVLVPVLRQRDFFFLWPPDRACREVYGNNPFPECERVADYLRAHCGPGGKIAVLGSEPELFFEAGRPSATGYIYIYGPMEPQPFASRMQREMASEIEASRPEYVVFVNVLKSWQPYPTSDRFILGWAGKYLRDLYRRVGVVDIFPGRTDYRWDAQAEGYEPRSPDNLLVYRRKE